MFRRLYSIVSVIAFFLFYGTAAAISFGDISSGVNSFLGVGSDMAWVGDVVIAFMTLGFGPGVIMLVVRVLAFPGFRQCCYAPVFAFGKLCSMTMSRWMGSGNAKKLEAAAQDFLVYILNAFYSGLDSDDEVETSKKISYK